MATSEQGGAASDSPVVSARCVRRTYLGDPVRALDGVSLTLPEGSFTAEEASAHAGRGGTVRICVARRNEGDEMEPEDYRDETTTERTIP